MAVATAATLLALLLFVSQEPVTLSAGALRSANKSNSTVVPQISGGRAARKNQFPFMTAIFREDDNGIESFLCGGTLVSPWVVMTSAICASPFVGNGTGIVRVGLNKIRDKMAPERRIEEVYIHPGFDISYQLNGNVGLLQLSRRIGNKRPVKLPPPSLALAVEQSVHVVGFGLVRNETASNKLRFTGLNALSESACWDVLVQEVPSVSVFNLTNLLCTTSSRARGICEGDTGGPVMTRGRNARQVGIILEGTKSCGEADALAVHTDVRVLQPWVARMISLIERAAKARRKRTRRV